MFQICQVDAMQFGAIPILSISCKVQGLNTQIQHFIHPNSRYTYTALERSQTPFSQNRFGEFVLGYCLCKKMMICTRAEKSKSLIR